jgi:hypothetical protein
MPDAWKICSVCRKPIPFGGLYYRWSASTCNVKRRMLVFCCLDCWDAHLPDMKHRSPLAVEEMAPRA